MKHGIGCSGLSRAVLAALVAAAPAAAQPAPQAPRDSSRLWQFLGSEQNKASVAPARGAAKGFVPSICSGAYPPPGCDTGVEQFRKDPANQDGAGTGG